MLLVAAAPVGADPRVCALHMRTNTPQANIVCPNKHSGVGEVFYNGHLLDSQTYIGGKVEALESGVFRSDIPTRFKCCPETYQVRQLLAV